MQAERHVQVVCGNDQPVKPFRIHDYASAQACMQGNDQKWRSGSSREHDAYSLHAVYKCNE